MTYIKDILLISLGYLLGGLSTGYYLILFTKGTDVRKQGSHAVGATNVGRMLGAPGFVITFLGDALKGALIVWLGFYVEAHYWAIVLTVLTVIAGHIFPLQLGFKGGKGIATALGAVVILDYQLVIVCLGIFLLTLIISRFFKFSGLLSVTLSPIAAIVLSRSVIELIGLIVLVPLVLFAHRTFVGELIEKVKPKRR